ncbi:MAG: DUF2796 domain-containing protein [Albimonas sp.]|uniref:DUF2796 domain-containing protein n=1 Tax=Albimonas sp. TaxID=1872425 RepID=UPI004055CA5F|tara:strand:+ start:441 stop:1058 length:618 start_codon:yes stop_codon:yes gene_type:complete
MTRRLAPLALLALGLAAHPATAQEHRALGAHVHGHGRLDIAREGDRIALALVAPGADVVGFEHAPQSEADRAAVEAALDRLSRPLELIAFPEAAGCEVLEVAAELVGEDHAEDEAHAHDDGDDHAHDEGDEHAHDDHDEAGGHSEFHALWELSCTDPGAIDALAFPYFDAFPGAQELAVQVVSDGGARAFEVERDAPELDLDGAL